MSWRRRRPPGGLLCLPSACDAHPFDAVSLDLPSDVVRASLSGVPNSFYLPADRTHSSDEGVKCPRRRLHGPSRPDTALCPLISRGWRPVRRLRDLSHCRQLGSSWPGLQPRCSSIGPPFTRPKRWAIAGPRLSPPWPVAPKPWSSLRQSVGPNHTYQTAPSEQVGPPGRPHNYSSELAPARSQTRIWGGILVWRLSYALLLFGGTLGSGPSRAQSPPPGQHAYNVLSYSPNTHYFYRASRCKCEIVNIGLSFQNKLSINVNENWYRNSLEWILLHNVEQNPNCGLTVGCCSFVVLSVGEVNVSVFTGMLG